MHVNTFVYVCEYVCVYTNTEIKYAESTFVVCVNKVSRKVRREGTLEKLEGKKVTWNSDIILFY